MFLAMLGEAQANLRDDQLNARKDAAKKGEQLPSEYGILYEGQRAIVKGLMRVPVLRKLVKDPDALLDMHEKGTLMSVFEEQMEQIDRLEECLHGLNDKVEAFMAAFNGGPSASLLSQQSQANSRGGDGTLERVERLLLEMREMRWESDPRRRHKASCRESSFTRPVKEINGPGEESRGESRNAEGTTTPTARPDERKAPEATHTRGESRREHSRPRDFSGERRGHHRHGSREHPGRSTSCITKEHTHYEERAYDGSLTHNGERAHNGSPVLASHKLRA